MRVCVRHSQIKTSCHRLTDIRQAPVFWHPPFSLSFSIMSHDQIIGIHDLSIQLPHKLPSFAHPLIVFPPFLKFFSPTFLVFSPIPMESHRNVFMLWNGRKINEFWAECTDFHLSLDFFYRKGYEMHRGKKTSSRHSEKKKRKVTDSVLSSTGFQKAKRLHPRSVSLCERNHEVIFH